MIAIKWHLGHVVKAMRDDRGWSQTQLGAKAKLNKATIVSVEKQDRNHGRHTYEAIARAFGVSVLDLYAAVPPEQETSRLAATGTAGQPFPERQRESDRPPPRASERRRPRKP